MKLLQNIKWISGSTCAIILAFGLSACNNSKQEEASAAEVNLAEPGDLFELPAEETAATSPSMPAMDDPDAVVARVDGEDITQADYMSEVNMIMQRMQSDPRMDPQQLAQMQDEIMQGALENLIMRRVIMNEVEAAEIVVEDTEIDEFIAEIMEQMPPGVTLEAQLEQAGITEEELRDNMREEMRMQKLFEENIEFGTPTEEEIAAFHAEHIDDFFAQPESVTASHILISTQGVTDPEELATARARISDIRQQLLDGADFSTLATAESSCPSSAQGGDLGPFQRGMMAPPFEEAAFSQEIGVIGDVVETQFGYHIIKVTDRTEAGTVPLEEVRDRIAEHLSADGRNEAMRIYVEGLREKSEVEILNAP
jgi:peptidyl-prolyl cis-trans isomerase C